MNKRLCLSFSLLLAGTMLNSTSWAEPDLTQYNDEVKEIEEKAFQQEKETQEWEAEEIKKINVEANWRKEKIKDWRNTELARIREDMKKNLEGATHEPLAARPLVPDLGAAQSSGVLQSVHDISSTSFAVGSVTSQEVQDAGIQFLGDITNKSGVDIDSATFELTGYDAENNPVVVKTFRIPRFKKYETRAFAVRFSAPSKAIVKHKIVYQP